MKCKVKNCGNSNHNAASVCSFFPFPSDTKTSRIWISFCRQENSFNTKTSFICMKHFTADDIENIMQFEMGFAKHRILKRDAVPSIYDPLAGNPALAAERKKRIQKRENKKIVNLLLQEDDITARNLTLHEVYIENDSSMGNVPSVEPIQEKNVERQSEQVEEKTNALTRHFVEEIESLRQEIKILRKENSFLQNAHKTQTIQLRHKNKEIRKLKKDLEENVYKRKWKLCNTVK